MSVLVSIAAQEALKAISGKFMPFRQVRVCGSMLTDAEICWRSKRFPASSCRSVRYASVSCSCLLHTCPHTMYMSAYVCPHTDVMPIRQFFVSIREHAPAYVSIRQHTYTTMYVSAY